MKIPFLWKYGANFYLNSKFYLDILISKFSLDKGNLLKLKYLILK
jgi:hypothetical protein